MKKENKILDAAFAVVSGTLTELIYNEISTSYYKKQLVDETEIFIEECQIPFGIKILIIISLFLVIWLILSVIAPRIIYKAKSTIRKRRPTYNTREIIQSFNEIKRTVQDVAFVFNNQFSKISFTLLYSDDIANCINKLHTIFCSTNKAQIKTVEFVFRNAASINTKGKLISRYEFISLISVIEKLFLECMKKEKTDASNYSLFDSDVEALKQKIEDLKKSI